MAPINNSNMDSYHTNQPPTCDEDSKCTINPTPYTYPAFRNNKSIRLITLFPSSDDPRLRCTLEEVDLDYYEDYEAISYVWGDDQTPAASIVCNSKGEELGITRNLEAVLTRFRLSDKLRRLWVDGICVNQQDDKERSQQVKLIGRIYREATTVLIWLGEEDEDTLSAWECIRFFGVKKGPPPPRAFQALEKLLNRAWFHRAWTFQEIILARRALIFCGRHHIGRKVFGRVFLLAAQPEYKDLEDAKFLLEKYEEVLLSFLQVGQPGMLDLGGNPFCPADLLQLLELRRGKLCTNPRDICYSLLGVATNGSEIEPDYTKSVDEVYIDFARYFLGGKRGLCVLGLVETNRSSSLPTWVPDWSVRGKAKVPLTDLSARIYNATGSSYFRNQRVANARQLLLQGLKVGCSPSWESFVKRHAATYEHPNHSIRKAYTRTLVADVNPLLDGERWSDEKFVQEFEQCLQEDKNGASPFWVRVYKVTRNRRLFYTRGCRIGLAPNNACQGDIICLLLGGEVPFILRRKDDEYELVGECYVHGLMDGEGLMEVARRAQPDVEHINTSWLYQLDEELLPFETEEFVLN